MSDGSNAAVALALGAGGGLLVWYLFRKHDGSSPRPPTSEVASSPSTSSTKTAASSDASPSGAPPRTAGPCSLLLTANGLTVDGDAADIPTAVARCKAFGSAQLVVAGDAPAGAYADLAKALHDGGVAVTVKAS
jgi:hypothetical protein